MTKLRGSIFIVSLLLPAVTFVGCGGSGGGRFADYDDYRSNDSEVDEDAAHDAAEVASEEARQETYATAGASSDGTGADARIVSADDIEQPVFDYCTDDCSGHEAGFEWARDNDVTDGSECGGNSDSFYSGCLQFAEERQTHVDREIQGAAEEAALLAAEAAEYEPSEEDVDYDDGRLLDGRY